MEILLGESENIGQLKFIREWALVQSEASHWLLNYLQLESIKVLPE